MQQLILNDLTSWITDLRWNHSTIYFLSVVGPTNSVGSVWSHFISDKLTLDTSNCGVRGHPYGLQPERKTDYTILKAPMGKGAQQIVFVHPCFSPQQTEPNLFGVFDNPDNFWQRFIRWCPIPVKPSWKDTIWHIGTTLLLIRPLSGFGREAWLVDTRSQSWLPHIKSGIELGHLK